jgi:hypothetical protein
MEEVWRLFIENCRKLGRSQRIAWSIELAHVGYPSVGVETPNQ